MGPATTTEFIEVGETAPNFTLKDQSGTTVSLSDFKDKIVVLYFYPKDDTPGCTVEACDFRDNFGRLTSEGVVVLGVSPDDEKKHTKFVNKYDLPFTLLADPEKQVLKAYGAWGLKKLYGREFEGVKRSTYIINTKGEVAKVWKSVKVKGHVEKVLEEVRKLNI